MGSEGVEDQRRHTALTSQNGRLDGEDWYDVRHGRLIITPDGTAKEEEHQKSREVEPCGMSVCQRKVNMSS